MGTNYYLHLNVCQHCKKADEVKHIGKSSGGWTFSFRGYRPPAFDAEPPISSWSEWLDYLRSMLATGKAEIRDEYDTVTSLEDFIRLVDGKRDSKNNHTLYCNVHHPEHARDCWLDEEGNSFTGTEFS